MKKKYYDLILLDSGCFCQKNNHNNQVDIFVKKSNSWEIELNSEDAIGHGTGVMSILLNNYYNGKFAVFQAFTSQTFSNINNIISALQYVDKFLNCKYIQMSFGVRAYNKELETICKKLYDKGIIIISAFDNSGAMSFPAAFDFVIGVAGDPYLKTKKDFLMSKDGCVDLFAKNGKQIVGKNEAKEFVVEQGNSFAASYVSLALLESNQTFDSKISALRFFDDTYDLPLKCIKESVLNTRAALFPLNKEMYALINYINMLKIKLVDIYDIKYSPNLGRIVNSFDKSHSFCVKNIEKCDWEQFDTLVIGHVRELSMLLKKDIKRELLEKCLQRGKNVYCFDIYLYEEYRTKFKEANLILECPDSFVLKNKQGRLYQLKTPILCVLGTNKKQGKFTLQMQIKEVLESNDINVGMLGTEPNSLLLGCDEVLPLGYDGTIATKNGTYIIESVNYKLHQIDVLEKDIIITGGQSGFYPHITFNTGHININQFAFLYGVLPDGVILTFTETDTSDYLLKSIKAIESITNTKVFLLALYAFHTEKDYVIDFSKRLLTDEEIAIQQERIKRDLNLDIIVSGDYRYKELLFEKIIQFYCEPLKE